MRLLSALALLVLMPIPVLGGEIHVAAPAGAEPPLLALYGVAAGMDEPPLALVVDGAPADLPDGHYRFGIDGYPWRSAPFTHEGETTLQLGSLALSAPPGALADFTLHDADSGALVAQVRAGAALAIPSGRFDLRRDLAEMALPVEIPAGEALELRLGALGLARPLERGTAVYVAPEDRDAIVGVLHAGAGMIALPAGAYRLRAPAGPAARAVVTPGEQTLAPLRVVRLTRAAGGTVRLVHGGREINHEVSGGHDVILLDDAELSVVTEDGGPRALPSAPEIWIWQTSDGAVANFDGLPLAPADGAGAVALPGGELQFNTDFGFAAPARVAVLQGGNVIAETTLDLRGGPVAFTLQVPPDIATEPPLEVTIATGPAGAQLTGRFGPLPVHRFLAEPPPNLSVSNVKATEISLSWAPSGEAGVAGYRVFRGTSDYPASGENPIEETSFTDNALSAGRTYTYRVCSVDLLGQDGACATTTATTLRP